MKYFQLKFGGIYGKKKRRDGMKDNENHEISALHFSIRKFAGFTIIELLVVITMIVILASLLLPTLQKIRDKAYSITCMNNLKTLGTGIYYYSMDNNGFAPGVNSLLIKYDLWTRSGEWGVGQYLGVGSGGAQNPSKSIFCPKGGRDHMAPPGSIRIVSESSSYDTNINFSYALNYHISNVAMAGRPDVYQKYSSGNFLSKRMIVGEIGRTPPYGTSIPGAVSIDRTDYFRLSHPVYRGCNIAFCDGHVAQYVFKRSYNGWSGGSDPEHLFRDNY